MIPATAASAVGSFAACVGGVPGLYDMSGNLGEWGDACAANTGENDYCQVRGGWLGVDDTGGFLQCGSQQPEKRSVVGDTVASVAAANRSRRRTGSTSRSRARCWPRQGDSCRRCRTVLASAPLDGPVSAEFRGSRPRWPRFSAICYSAGGEATGDDAAAPFVAATAPFVAGAAAASSFLASFSI